jgi:hypothetical protein
MLIFSHLLLAFIAALALGHRDDSELLEKLAYKYGEGYLITSQAND